MQYLKLSDTEIQTLKSSSTDQDAFLAHLLKKFDEHISK